MMLDRSSITARKAIPFASALGRSTRFFLVAATIYIFGPRVQTLLERYLEAATLVLFVLLVGGFVLLKQFAH